MSASLDRRRFLQGAAALPLVGLGACTTGSRNPDAARPFRITLTGQALMTHDICQYPYPGFGQVVTELQRGDAVFTGLEAPVSTPRSGAPTRTGTFLHVAPATVPGCLRQMGFNLLALSNNHSYDLGTAGVLATREAVAAAGFAYAGTGRDLSEASAAGYLEGRKRVALVAMAIEKVAEGGAATADRAGVNEVRMSGAEPDEQDLQRVLSSIELAAGQSDYVVTFLSNHAWGDDLARTKPWARRLAQRCVDAGTDVFVAHGAPLLHGIEMYRGRPLLHSLGSLVFHSRTAPGHYPPAVWESAIVHCDFSGDELAGMQVIPVVLNELGDDPARQNETRGRPRVATGDDRARILARIDTLSAALR